MTKTVKGYAKINLHLDICGIREDGYHDVETVMQTLSLCDTVSVSLIEGGEIFCECNVAGVPTDEKNIAVKAATLFLKEANINSGVHIKIEKNIPMAAGLAGGSTDAAATLRGLNALCKDIFDMQKLCEIGSRLGADVPFCIKGGCAYTDGKGDIIHDFPPLPEDTVFLVACGGEGVSTPWAYRLMDEVFENFKDYIPKGVNSLKKALLSDAPYDFSNHLFNIFEEPVLAHRPVVAEIKEIMLEHQASAAMMSGSGPSVFGIFKDKKLAEIAEEKIKNRGYFAQICVPVSM